MNSTIKKIGLTTLSTAAVAAGFFFASAAQAANIVVNGGFELPELVPNSFTIENPIPGWQLGPGSLGTGIEVQRQNIAGTAFEGQQFAELDSTNVTAIEQILDTVPGLQYFLRFAWSPRPLGSSGAPNTPFPNHLNVSWGGTSVANLVRQSTSSTVQWLEYEFIVTANSNQTLLRFDNIGEPGPVSFGSYLDAVSVTPVPTPALLPGLVGMGIAALKRKSSDESAEENA